MSDLFIGDVFDVLPTLEAGSVQMCVTSPPYWGLRDYGVDKQLGLESTPAEFVARMVDVFRQVRRVLKDDGTCWVNLGDSYAGSSQNGGIDPSGLLGYGNSGTRNVVDTHAPKRGLGGLKPKDLCGIPWRVAFALQDDGWHLRQDIIWHKPNPMPESVTDRCTKAHEYVFLLSKRARYYFDAEAIAEKATHAGKTVTLGEKSLSKGQAAGLGIDASGNGNADSVLVADNRNRRSVWTVPSEAYVDAHFATYPKKLIEPCILAGSRPGDVVLDPFFGSGTTGEVCERLGRQWVGVEINPEYAAMARRRTAQQGLSL